MNKPKLNAKREDSKIKAELENLFLLVKIRDISIQCIKFCLPLAVITFILAGVSFILFDPILVKPCWIITGLMFLISAICAPFTFFLRDFQVNFIRALNPINEKIYPLSRWNAKWFPYIQNIEISRRFLRERGVEVFKTLDDLTILDEDDTYYFVRFKYKNIRGEQDKALIYNCPSSGDTYFSIVRNNIETLEDALRFLNNGIKQHQLNCES